MKEVKPRSKRLLFLAAGVLLLAGFLVSRFVCVGAWIRYGVVVPTCPDGRLRQTLAVDCRNLRRGAEGTARVEAFARYTTASPDEEKLTTLRRYEASLALVKEKGEEIPAAPGARLADGQRRPHGRHRAAQGSARRRLQAASAGPLAAGRGPARSAAGGVRAGAHPRHHRPALYEPGNTVQFRAVVLRATDFGPVDNRPGAGIVRDPEGTTVLEEKAPRAVRGGVGQLPARQARPRRRVEGELDVGRRPRTPAPSGSSPSRCRASHVEAAPVKPFYRAGDRPVVKGKVLYTSGAPVRGAALDIEWTVSGGEWPPPPDWEQGGLPKRASTDASGAFALTLPVVPTDLRGG
jgi:hypothetical protein